MSYNYDPPAQPLYPDLVLMWTSQTPFPCTLCGEPVGAAHEQPTEDPGLMVWTCSEKE